MWNQKDSKSGAGALLLPSGGGEMFFFYRQAEHFKLNLSIILRASGFAPYPALNETPAKGDTDVSYIA